MVGVAPEREHSPPLCLTLEHGFICLAMRVGVLLAPELPQCGSLVSGSSYVASKSQIEPSF